MRVFVKRKRAQTNEDYETWEEGSVCPTLNAMDNSAESYATVLALDTKDGQSSSISPTLRARNGVDSNQPGGGHIAIVVSNEQEEDQEPGQVIGFYPWAGSTQSISALDNQSPALKLGTSGAQVAVSVHGSKTHSLTSEGGSEDGTGRGTPIVALQAAYTSDSVSRPAVGVMAFYSTGGSRNISSREEISPPLKVGSGLDIASPVATTTTEGVRRLTPRECERLQGFPDDWTDGQSDSARYRQLGNAVAVPVVEWILRRLVDVDRQAT